MEAASPIALSVESASEKASARRLPASFETHPDRYVHWKVSYDGPLARLAMDVQEERPLVPGGHPLKLNSYDLGVDLELADFVTRLPFEHPEVRAVIVTSARDRVFCAGANIQMLAASSHGFKVNFCKFTNETRLAMEQLSAGAGVKWLAALNGTCAGGGYELALACDEIVLVDDGSSAVSLPEVPLLGVLPGTGGLTRVVDKRRVRRDRADVFCTVAEGIKGRRAVQWNLVDHLAPRSRFEAFVSERASQLARPGLADREAPIAPAVTLPPLAPSFDDQGNTVRWRWVELTVESSARTARLTVRAPDTSPPAELAGIHAAGAELWHLQAFRELDDALLRLRFHHDDVNVVELRAMGDASRVLAADAALVRHAADPFVRNVRLLVDRVLRRLDLTARSFFAVADAGSAFAGTLLELALAADRTYALDDEDTPGRFAFSELNFGAFPMSHGLTRLSLRVFGSGDDVGGGGDGDDGGGNWTSAFRNRIGDILDAAEADELGLVTVLADEIDFEDELRVAVEERASISPDALTGMEASLRFVGPESLETKIFGRLSAWQNWIFTRPNATGPTGALTRYGQPEKPQFDWRRT